MNFEREFHGPNSGYVLELYERYRSDPQSVDEATRSFFKHWSPPVDGMAPAAAVGTASFDKIVGAVNLAQSIRGYGHLAAKLDPLGTRPTGDPALDPQSHGITDDDLRGLPASLVGGPIAATASSAYEAIQMLREVYSNHIGFDNDHIRIPEEREWLREAAESRRFRVENNDDFARALLERLTQVEAFEHFLQDAFPTKYRFSIEGLDMMVPMLDEVIDAASQSGMSNVLFGMAHRGRLNLMAHNMKKPYEQILAEFRDPLKIQEMQNAIGWTVGDVKYHEGSERAIKSGNAHELTITMPPNPSHLEMVNPVVMGMARAAGTNVSHAGAAEFDPNLTMQLLIHGDAAFPGQGIVAETFNLSQIPGYWTGGTIHIIANNRIGFTTLPEDGRSTLYASDLAKGFKVPIIHVNADDPEACIEVTRMAYAYQQEFEKDILIDLIGYRRYGHNELDEPAFTQPVLYQAVREHPTVRQQWADILIQRGLTDEESVAALSKQFTENLKQINDALPEAFEERAEELVDPQPPPPEPGEARRIKTAVPEDRLQAINSALATLPENFKFYSNRLERSIRGRRDVLDKPDEAAVDWAGAEELAFATILEDGIAIRLTGQDTERGTFNHRHAVLHNAETGETFVPLQQLEQAQATFEVYNSPLSELGVLGFEYGYSIQAPNRLVIWEAQYGDFINGAQGIVDEYLVSAREKWGQTPSLVLLLPHGWEGAGPDHSSGRLERFLQLAANTNMRVANPTTAAQYFHLLRRQAHLLQTDPLPLVIMTPKGLLRNPVSNSPARDLMDGKWQPVIDDPDADPDKITRLVLCSGKFYFDLVNSEYRQQYEQVALVRVEQLYPFPIPDLQAVVERYPNIQQIVWAQEEPKNMGAWDYIGFRLNRLVEGKLPVDYVGRRRSPSPAEGSSTAHKTNHAMIVEYAFNWEFEQ
ncbi:MAG: 2-oxoglutarate dehydrogenase E1 component [Anaerolineaceae bacterium]|nr:2-oxoglutarate dehydrogenase E1 component [Anaerolineaceae bacterium]